MYVIDYVSAALRSSRGKDRSLSCNYMYVCIYLCTYFYAWASLITTMVMMIHDTASEAYIKQQVRGLHIIFLWYIYTYIYIHTHRYIHTRVCMERLNPKEIFKACTYQHLKPWAQQAMCLDTAYNTVWTWIRAHGSYLVCRHDFEILACGAQWVVRLL